MTTWGGVNIREFRNFQRNIQRLSGEELDKFCRSAAKELAARLLRKVKMRTPVGQYPSGSGKVGGTLRNGWTIEADITRVGNEYEIVVYNPVNYASYVEFGHRTRGGKGWVEGRFMMTKSEMEIQNQAEKILERKLMKLLGELINGE